jgi:nucleoside-diphosphate-sugar epimerase
VRVIVVGARGFVGSAVVAEARSRGLTTIARSAEDEPEGDAQAAIVFTSGLASGAAQQPQLAFRRHVYDAARWLAAPHHAFVYVSSTRVYDGAPSTRESTVLAVEPASADPYVSSKIAGESLALASSPHAIVVRLSNVAGPSTRSELFLSDVLRQAARDGVVSLRSTLDSSKDYIDVRDAAAWILDAATARAPRVVNLAAGRNTTHGELLAALAQVTPLRVVVAPGAPTVVVPSIDTAAVQAAFPRRLYDPVAELPGYFAAFQTEKV